MNSKTSKFLFLFFVSMSLIGYAADGNKKNSKSLNKTQGTPVRTFLNINNVSSQFYNDENSDITPEGNSGVVFPKGSGKTAVFESGLIWGAKIPGDPQVRVGGSTHRQGMQPGKIISPGVAEDPNLSKNRIYRVRPDVYPGGPSVNLSGEAIDEGSDTVAVREQYEKDWREWPATDGAPYEDVNSDGVWSPDPNNDGIYGKFQTKNAQGNPIDTVFQDVPGVKGADQTIWFVCNDLDPSKTQFMYGTLPLGIELQGTIWAYAQTGALGNMFFRKYKLINKSNTTFDSMYVSMWSDVDLGFATDDYAGCDTLLSLGYVYNANATDDVYKPLPPPAVGFDFFQGPLLTGVAGEDRNKNGVDDAADYGIFNGKKVGPGKINLPMTAFYYFARGDASVVDPTQGAAQGATQFYNFFQGKIGLTGAFFTDPNTLQPTTYAVPGDPQTRTGWIDGQLIPPDDRRIGSSSGPFQMAPGDTQEVVVSEILAGAIPGTDRLSAIGLLKFYDQQAQLAYDNFFDLPVAPPAPEVNPVELDKEIVLDWGFDNSKVTATETSDSKGYKFQGYNVYQLPSSSADVSTGKRIATYDVIDGIGKIIDYFFDATTGVVAKGVRQFGNDTGIKRYLDIKNDELKGGTPLINGIRYYYAVTSYSYNPDPLAVPNNLENPLKILTVVPSSTMPGVRLGAASGDTLVTVHTGGSDGEVLPLVVDPTKLTGHNYKVSFYTDTETGETYWKLTDVSLNKVLLDKQSNQSGDNVYPSVDGLLVKVLGPPVQVNTYTFTPAADRWFTGYSGLGGEAFFGGLTTGSNFFGSNITPDQYVTVEMRFVTDRNNGQRAYRYLRGGDPNYGYQDYEKQYFTVWNVDVNPPVQISAAYVEQNGSAAANQTWQPTANPAADREYLFIIKSPYTESPDAYYTSRPANDQSEYPTLYGMWPAQRGTMPFNPQNGQVFTIIPNYANTTLDEFTFTSPAPTSSTDLAKQDIEKVNVFPNPYYGVNSEEINKYNRFVTFSHLPTKATIRIFNLAGVLVKEIDKNSTDQFQRWDLANNSGLPVASGLYIAYIDMPDVGKTKILKVAIIQEQQILDRY
jgi:hypothetical protein